MDQCTRDVRAARWRNVLHCCQQRPDGQSVKQWLDENNILEQSYYYWQRKFRNEAYDQMNQPNLPSVQDTHSAVSFVEISAPVHQEVSTDCNSDAIQTAAVIKTAVMSIAISNNISEHLLTKILQEVVHA